MSKMDVEIFDIMPKACGFDPHPCTSVDDARQVLRASSP